MCCRPVTTCSTHSELCRRSVTETTQALTSAVTADAKAATESVIADVTEGEHGRATPVLWGWQRCLLLATSLPAFLSHCPLLSESSMRSRVIMSCGRVCRPWPPARAPALLLLSAPLLSSCDCDCDSWQVINGFSQLTVPPNRRSVCTAKNVAMHATDNVIERGRGYIPGQGPGSGSG